MERGMKKGFLLSPGTGKEEKKEEEIKKLNKAEPTPETNKAAPENNETLNKDKVKVSDGAGASQSTPPPAPGSSTPPSKNKKRRRTISRNPSLSPSPGRGFIVPGFTNTNGANTQMSTAELMDASKGITNMALAHEIAVNKDFQLEKIRPEGSSVEESIREIMHRAFWDVLKEELEAKPPKFNQAMVLLEEIKELLISLLLPQHGKLREKIDEVLDTALIQQQIDAGTLEFEKYAGYILGMMSMLCAPVRDDKIAQLKTESQVVAIFKGIIETLELMKIDMANFTIQQARPMIVSKSVEYEKLKFKEFLETVEDGLSATRQWLVRHAPSQEESEDPKYQKLLGTRVLTDAFLEILEWDDYYTLPETLTMDARRIVDLRDQVERTSVSTACILVSFSSLNPYIVPQDSQKLKEKVKQHIDILLQDFYEDADLLKILPGVGLQIVSDVNSNLEEKGKPLLPQPLATSLCEQIEGLEDPNNFIILD
ncbi:T-complex protein 11-like protein 1 isoform X2 [Eurytemora carolleeae]|uniref:T-complex protein 11-like protein 1 isoform X2 n=1 Tax=Eurytemora carolleeae TaxID=1294199 RepID=UPI000C7865CA|nr:T-complex protein 11-like protein 1 isoform X2 [Eurytemora carolleeae]|eukprot:XP_023321809.1 T-complex protein 11-like protein 1 isoform X2 [Eurytemora affinis]